MSFQLIVNGVWKEQIASANGMFMLKRFIDKEVGPLQQFFDTFETKDIAGVKRDIETRLSDASPEVKRVLLNIRDAIGDAEGNATIEQ